MCPAGGRISVGPAGGDGASALLGTASRSRALPPREAPYRGVRAMEDLQRLSCKDPQQPRETTHWAPPGTTRALPRRLIATDAAPRSLRQLLSHCWLLSVLLAHCPFEEAAELVGDTGRVWGAVYKPKDYTTSGTTSRKKFKLRKLKSYGQIDFGNRKITLKTCFKKYSI